MEPAVLVDDCSGALRVFVVAQHDAAAPEAKLPVGIDLALGIPRRFAQCADVCFVLLHVQQAVGRQLRLGVALVDEDPLLHQSQQDPGVQRSGAAAHIPQTAQPLFMAAADLVVDHFDQHRRRGDGVAGHQLQIPEEVARIAADVLIAAVDRIEPQIDEARQMEERHQRKMADGSVLELSRSVFLPEFRDPGFRRDIHFAGREEIPLREHDALAASGGARSKHHQQQAVRVDAVGQLPGLAVLVSVHRTQEGAVFVFQLLPVAVVDAVVEDQSRLDQLQLILQLRPQLFIVQGHEDGSRQHDAIGQHRILVVVPAQDGDLFALEIRDGRVQIGHGAADVLCQLRIRPRPDGLAVLCHGTQCHPLRVERFHRAGDQLVEIGRHFFQ